MVWWISSNRPNLDLQPTKIQESSMPNILKALVERISKTKISTQKSYHKGNQATTDLTPTLEHSGYFAEGQTYPIWQITVPLGVVLIFAIGAFTAYSMVEGRYLFDLSINREQIRIRTDVDKRESSSASASKTLDKNDEANDFHSFE
jgi:hypothetical protein